MLLTLKEPMDFDGKASDFNESTESTEDVKLLELRIFEVVDLGLLQKSATYFASRTSNLCFHVN